MKTVMVLMAMAIALSGVSAAYAHKPIRKPVPKETTAPIDMDFFDEISGD